MNDPTNNSTLANNDEKLPANKQGKGVSLNQRLSVWVIVLVVVVIFGLTHHRLTSKNNSKAAQPTLVVTTPSHRRDVPVYFTALGGVTPTYTVTVKTQINGQLLHVYFKEGQMVKAGDVLAQIDPRPYEAQLIQYQGQLQRDTALLANARIDLKRYQTLWRQNSISQQTLATQLSLVQQYEGDVKADEGLIESTKVNLMYCRITSPIDGRIGLRLVDPGNFVQTSDTTGIAVVNTLNPITVIFTLAEDYVPLILPQIYANKPFQVQAYDRQQNKLLATGNLLTIDNQIDTTTGTVKLKANFANNDNRLFANQFVNIKLLVKTLHNALVVQTAAIQHGVNGEFVYVLNADQTVKETMVKTGVIDKDDTVILSGLAAGQQVVIEGADKLTDGAKVILADKTKPTSTVQVANKVNSRRFWA